MQVSPIQIVVGVVGLLWLIGITITQIVFLFGRWAGKHESKERVIDELLSPTKIGYQIGQMELALQKLNDDLRSSNREHVDARRVMEERIYTLLAGHLTMTAFEIFTAQYQRDLAHVRTQLEKLFLRRGDGGSNRRGVASESGDD